MHKAKITELPDIFAGKVDETAIKQLIMVFSANCNARFHSERSRLGSSDNSEFKQEFFNFVYKKFGFPPSNECGDFAKNAALELLQSE